MTAATDIFKSLAGHFEHGTLAAEFTVGSKTRPAMLTINRIAGGRRTHVASITVSGKREARAVAASHGATPWNF